MKNKKIIIILIAILVLVASLYAAISTNSKKNDEAYKEYNKIIKKINNKESVLIYFYDKNLKNKSDKEMLKYYKDTYKLDYISFGRNDYPYELYEDFKKVAKFTEVENESQYFIYFNGKEGTIVRHPFIDEFSLRKFLIDEGIIEKKYNKIDHLTEDSEINKYFKTKNEELFVILKNDKDVYKYRNILYKNNIESNIIYTHRISNTGCLNELIKIKKDIKENSVIWIKNKKVDNYIDGITPENFEKVVKNRQK